MSTIVTVHTFCASHHTRFPMGVPTNTGIFLSGFKLFGESRTLQDSAFGIQKENWG